MKINIKKNIVPIILAGSVLSLVGYKTTSPDKYDLLRDLGVNEDLINNEMFLEDIDSISDNGSVFKKAVIDDNKGIQIDNKEEDAYIFIDDNDLFLSKEEKTENFDNSKLIIRYPYQNNNKRAVYHIYNNYFGSYSIENSDNLTWQVIDYNGSLAYIIRENDEYKLIVEDRLANLDEEEYISINEDINKFIKDGNLKSTYQFLNKKLHNHETSKVEVKYTIKK